VIITIWNDRFWKDREEGGAYLWSWGVVRLEERKRKTGRLKDQGPNHFPNLGLMRVGWLGERNGGGGQTKRAVILNSGGLGGTPLPRGGEREPDAVRELAGGLSLK